MTIVGWATAVAFVLLAVLAFRLWRRRRSPPAAWVAGAFGLLACAVLTGQLVPDDAPDAAQLAATVVAVIGVLAFPYLLFRFAASFAETPVVVRRAAAAAAVAVIGLTLALAPFFSPPDAQPAWFSALLLTILGYWTALSVWVGLKLWRAGRSRPTVVRRRLRTLALASGLMNLALFVSVIGPGEDASAVARVIAIGAAGGFYLALSPPGFVRREWRRAEERMLRTAPVDVLRADTPAGAAEALLPRVARLFGAAEAVFLDGEHRPIATLGIDADDLGEAIATLTEVTEQHTVEQHGRWIVLRLGTGWLGVRADRYAPLFGSEEMELLASVGGIIDLALERVELLAAERAARAHVEATSREVEALLYGLSHDLRNPLVSVLGYLEVLEDDAGPVLDEDSRHYLDRLRVNAGYMDALIGDLLELSRIGRTQERTEPVALQPLVEELATEVRRDHPDAVVDVGRLPVVDLNPVRARQLFANLLGNAVAHAGRADVHVSVDVVGFDDARAEIVVADDGQGIPEDYRTRVFQIFERLGTSKTAGSTGIGLAMCQRIVEQAGGRIWIGDPPVGAAVHIQLPVASDTPDTRREVAS